MSAGYAWAREEAAAGGDTVGAGAFEFLLVTAASWTLMPLLLWAGLRVVANTPSAVPVTVGALVWAGGSGYFIDDLDRAGGHIPILVLAAYVLLGTGLAGAGPDRRD
ncbi:hypothetical protein ABZ330_29045 [Streptomyces sp. NPDC006172]|uniref:hypothetical protein n=1 Tax=Streptomyces sp. NPDC006172 TaxID=3154470 RepID=UPI003409617D